MQAKSPQNVLAILALLLALTLAWIKWDVLPPQSLTLTYPSRPITADQRHVRNEKVKMDVQTVLKTVAGLELPASADDFDFVNQSFRMSPEDANKLIGKFKVMDRTGDSIQGLLDYITVTKNKTHRQELRFELSPGYYTIKIHPESDAGTEVGRSEGFYIGDAYIFMLDPATGWAQWRFDGGRGDWD